MKNEKITKTNGAFQDTKSGEFCSAYQLMQYAKDGLMRDEDTFVWKTHRNKKGQVTE